MMSRFKRLLKPSSAVIITASVVGALLGIDYGLAREYREISRFYDVPAVEWQRFEGSVRAFTWDIAATVGALTALGILLAPDSKADERTALRKLARHKLAEAVLTEAEIQQWAAVLKEVDREDA